MFAGGLSIFIIGYAGRSSFFDDAAGINRISNVLGGRRLRINKCFHLSLAALTFWRICFTYLSGRLHSAVVDRLAILGRNGFHLLRDFLLIGRPHRRKRGIEYAVVKTNR